MVFKVDPKTWQGKKTLFVVDVSSVGRANEYREDVELKKPAQYRRKRLSVVLDGKEYGTNVLYALFRMMSEYGFDADYAFCFDTPKNLLKEKDARYKQGRTKATGEYFQQINMFRDILKQANYIVLEKNGYEADHMVFEALKQNYQNYEVINIISADNDLACYVSSKVNRINVLKNKVDITLSNYEEVLKIPYNSLRLYKATVGDQSDNIAGIYRFGEKKFLKFLEENVPEGTKFSKNEKKIILESNLTEEQKEQALYWLDFVLPLSVDVDARVKTKPDLSYMRLVLEMYKMKQALKSLS